MGKGPLLVVGAAGDVGRGIVTAALDGGRAVVAAGRNRTKLDELAGALSKERLVCVAGDIGSEEGAAALWDAACRPFGTIGEVVVSVSVNAFARPRPLLDWSAEELTEALSANLISHFIAARVFLPRLPEQGRLIGIGGGTADFIFPRMAHVSMAQAALRMLYKGLAREAGTGVATAQELMIVSMVAGQSNREEARDDWVTDAEVGRHVCAILDSPDLFPAPILQLRSRRQVGKPEE